MRNLIVKCLVLTLVLGFVAMDADAQRRSRRRGTTTTDTTGQSANQQQQITNNTQAPTYNPYGNTPIVMGATSGGWSDSVKKSMRQDAAFDKNAMVERTPLPYEHLRWDDALFTERVWRELDLREKINMPFRYKAEDDNGDQRFISILLRAVMTGKVTAFDANVDDRFTTPFDSVGVLSLVAGGEPDTLPVYNLLDPTKIDSFVVTRKAFNPEDVMKIRIKEEWVFDREASRMFVRIIGIAPLKTLFNEAGEERGATPMFWVYYPDMRPILATYEVYNPKNMGMGRMTWEELFESRMFGSYIVKSTIDNPLNKSIREYVKDPILRLLEGENMKERIFNYEQDLWSY